MIRRGFACLFVLALIGCFPQTVLSAPPFKAPATFNLGAVTGAEEGSSINLSLSLTTPRLGTVDASLDPNPAPVTGLVKIDQLNVASGGFWGSFENISASTTANAPRLNMSLPVSVVINSDTVTGLFLWSSDKVVFDPADFDITFMLGSIPYSVPVAGIPIPADYKNNTVSIQHQFDFSDTYEDYEFTASIGVNLVGRLEAQKPQGDPWLELTTNLSHTNTYTDGDPFQLFLSAGNPGPEQVVDLYLEMVTPEGENLYFPAYGPQFSLALAGFPLPASFYMAPMLVHDAVLPSVWPPIDSEGTYQFRISYADPVTGAVVGESGTVEFNYAPNPATGIYDGLWVGQAPVQEGSPAECGSFAEVTFNIVNSEITGEGIDQFGFGYPVTGRLDANGEVVDGKIYEEFQADIIEVGTYAGQVQGEALTGTWGDIYGCSGTFNVNRVPQ